MTDAQKLIELFKWFNLNFTVFSPSRNLDGSVKSPYWKLELVHYHSGEHGPRTGFVWLFDSDEKYQSMEAYHEE